MTTQKGYNLSKGIKRTALSLALGACFVGGVHAQSNSAGAVTGHAASGDTITITNPATGFSRTITVSGDGSYRFSALPTGKYTISRNGGNARDVTVNVGTAANIDFVNAAAGGDATTLDVITVQGSSINPIDVSSVESTTILTAEQINKLPVARDVTSVALLAPGTVRGDSAFGNLASFGGGSVAENAYFVNGFNITNAFKNLAFAQLPYEAIAEQQVKTGGYGAEFGRALGGVVNVVTKRGTNEFHAGGTIYFTPASLRGTNPNVYSNGGLNTGTTTTIPNPLTQEPSYLLADNSKDSAGDSGTAALWASGALIKDKLFAFGLLQYNRNTDQEAYGSLASGNSTVASTTSTSTSSKSPTWLLKLDWNISDNHILEMTAFSDKRKTETDVYRVASPNPPAGSPAGTLRDARKLLERTARLGTQYLETGGTSYSLKYTGYLTDNFTLSALYGHLESSRSDYGVASNGVRTSYEGRFGTGTGCPGISDSRPLAGRNPAVIPSCNFIPGGLLGSPNNEDKRDQFRIDAEWQLGDHLLRSGIDADRFKSFDGETREGGALWQYISNTNVVKNVFENGSNSKIESTAFYIEDSWSVTPNFLAYLGLRWDTFENKNGLNETYAKISNQFAPRLGFSWDVNGDSSFKIFGNAGRYALPLTATVAIRGASASIFSNEEYTFTGIDPVTGAPTGLTPVPGSLHYSNNEFGLPKNADSFASRNLEPMYQDEFILGFQAQITDSTAVGVRGIYRNLKRAIDDQCDYRAVREWAAGNGFTVNPDTDGFQEHNPDAPNEVSFYNPGFPFCRLYNPGSDGEFNMDVNGDGTFELVKISADKLGPKAKRTYQALEFFFESQWDKAFLQGSYTYGRSRGNSEGGVNSNNGQDDTGTTIDFDYPELMQGSYGYLPNDRRHSLKLFGNYELTDEWSVGGSLIVQSGRPVSCFGVYGSDDGVGYNTAYYSCSQDVGFNTVNDLGQRRRNNGTVIVPRGTAGRTPWTRDLSLNITYAPSYLKGVTFKVDAFNILNEHKATSLNEFGELTGGVPAGYLAYKQPATFQAPRAFRFTVQYDF